MASDDGLGITDDWMKDIICLKCWALPCDCSRATRVLRRIHARLGIIVSNRYRKRQAQLQAELRKKLHAGVV